MSNVVTRYTDVELEDFRLILEDKLDKAKKQYENLITQIKEITENSSGDFTKDLTDFSSSQTEVELLNSMATRQRSYIQDLQNALIRIRNKSYGICVVTGQLIDKKRLMAVPTTTKSVIAKTEGEQQAMAAMAAKQKADQEEEEEVKKKKEVIIKKPVIITKVIKKSSTSTAKPKKSFEDDEDDELDEILKDLDNFGEEGDVTFDDDLDIDDDTTTGFDDDFDIADESDDQDDED